MALRSSCLHVAVAVVPEAPGFGDESVTLSYGFQPLQTLTTRGTLIAVRVGAIVARVQVDALYEASDAGTSVDLILLIIVILRP